MDASRSAVIAVRAGVRSALADLPSGAVVLVACSGGPDSLALAAATAGLAGQHGWLAGAVVVDHGWSQAATDASARAARTCGDLGLDPVDLIPVDSTGPGGPEAAARAARYRALAAAAEQHQASAVLLGHTLDDQAETVLLGLARGSGARSLAGMAAVRDRYRRPLLRLRRADTVAACAGFGLEPWLDPANLDPHYARVRLRGLVGELEQVLGPGVLPALARTADLLREDADALDAAATLLLGQADVAQAGVAQAGVAQAGVAPAGLTEPEFAQARAVGSGQLAVAVLLAAPVAVRRRALLAAARAAGCPGGSLGRVHALALDALLVARTGAATDLPGGLRAALRRRPGGVRVLVFAPGRATRAGMGNLPPSTGPE